MKISYKIRFHLGQGPHFKMWQIKYGQSVTFLDPKKYSISMWHCKLKNNRNIANKIFAGENKTVCAYIEAKDITITSNMPIIGSPAEICYNPRNNPFWICNNENFDNKYFNFLHTQGNKIFCPFLAA